MTTSRRAITNVSVAPPPPAENLVLIYGGSSDWLVHGLVFDENDNLFVCGGTNEGNSQSQLTGFIDKLDTDLNQLDYVGHGERGFPTWSLGEIFTIEYSQTYGRVFSQRITYYGSTLISFLSSNLAFVTTGAAYNFDNLSRSRIRYWIRMQDAYDQTKLLIAENTKDDGGNSGVIKPSKIININGAYSAAQRGFANIISIADSVGTDAYRSEIGNDFVCVNAWVGGTATVGRFAESDYATNTTRAISGSVGTTDLYSVDGISSEIYFAGTDDNGAFIIVSNNDFTIARQKQYTNIDTVIQIRFGRSSNLYLLGKSGNDHIIAVIDPSTLAVSEAFSISYTGNALSLEQINATPTRVGVVGTISGTPQQGCVMTFESTTYAGAESPSCAPDITFNNFSVTESTPSMSFIAGGNSGTQATGGTDWVGFEYTHTFTKTGPCS